MLVSFSYSGRDELTKMYQSFCSLFKKGGGWVGFTMCGNNEAMKTETPLLSAS